MWIKILIAVSLNTFAAAKSSGCIKPKISVPGAISDEYGYHQVREGPVEVYCSSDYNNLVFDTSETMHTETVNVTTVKTIFTPSSRVLLLKCLDSSNKCSNSAWITVNYNPNITNFHCFSNNFDSLNCSWNSQAFVNNYTLSLFSSWERISKCQGRINRRQYYSCLWDLSNVERLHDAHSRPLLVPVELQMCNIFECIYQKLDVDLISVTKLNPPQLDIQATGTSATLTWNIQIGALTLPSLMEIYYLIEYAIPGTVLRILTSGTAEYSPYEPFVNDLTLPCPGKQYTVRISCRFVDSPEDYMSEFAYASVRTEPDTNKTLDILDPICKTKPIEINPPVMKYKDQVLRQEVEAELSKHKKLMKKLRSKVALIDKIQLLMGRNV